MKKKWRLVVGLLALSLSSPSFANKPDYIFSTDWTSRVEQDWTEILKELKGAPNVQALEIGCFEGRSTIWLLDNILTHSTARITTIDTFGEYMGVKDMEARFDKNIQLSGWAKKVTKLIGLSEDELPKLKASSYDVIYIDGCHDIDCVMIDAVLSLLLLKKGGIIIFDDYGMDFQKDIRRKPTWSIDVFLAIFANRISLIKKDYQVFVRKL